MRGLQGKVAAVVGAGRRAGLGWAVAQRLVEEGCRVLIADRQCEDDELDDAVAALGDPDVARGRYCDVRHETEVRDLLEFAFMFWSRLDVVVSSAGIGHVIAPITDLSAEGWDAVQAVNLRGCFFTVKHAAALLREQASGGRIIAIGSIGARRGTSELAAYNASKHGMIGLMRSAAAELARDGITANTVCPNHVTTDMGRQQNEILSARKGVPVGEYLAGMEKRIPRGRLARASDVAAACAFLASDDGDFVNGVALDVNGGEFMS
jgi:NAD(P)-dependent dehydrogenase (short-subunit alcohol dehydrogenase family)